MKRSGMAPPRPPRQAHVVAAAQKIAGGFLATALAHELVAMANTSARRRRDLRRIARRMSVGLYVKLAEAKIIKGHFNGMSAQKRRAWERVVGQFVTEVEAERRRQESQFGGILREPPDRPRKSRRGPA